MRRDRVRIGWFEGVRSAIAGAVFGVLLFFASIALLWVNEGRTNLASVARRAAIASPAQVDRALDGALVSVTHETRADAALGDPDFLQPDRRLSLARRVEMFSWVESCQARRCDYQRAWSEHPPSSAHFREPSGHHNPAMRVRPARFTVDGSIGAYRFRTAVATLPSPERLALAPEMLRPDAPHRPKVSGAYVYIGDDSIDRPSVGDLRLSFFSVRAGEPSTFFARQDGDRLEPHVAEARMYRLLRGDRARAIESLATEHVVIGWVLRALGFLFLWVSMNLALAPLHAMFDVFPPLGRASRSLVAMLTLPVAAALSTVVIVLSALAHNVWLLIAVLLVLFVALLVARLRAK
jgi:hypothetical protein